MKKLSLATVTLLSTLLFSCQGPGSVFEDRVFSREGASQQFKQFLAMEGEWRIIGGDHSQGATHIYRTIANGSVVVETAFPGESSEMITVFHLDGPNLVMTHYCAARNQPYMVAEHPSGDKVHFRFERASDLNTGLYIKKEQCLLDNSDAIEEQSGEGSDNSLMTDEGMQYDEIDAQEEGDGGLQKQQLGFSKLHMEQKKLIDIAN